MGALLGHPMEKVKENMEANSEKMLHNQKELMLKQRQLMMAHQFAIGKDRFMFFQVLYGFAVIGLPLRAIKTKNPGILAPLVPLSIVFAYQWDMFYGNKMARVKLDAENMIREQPELFMPASNNMLMSEEEYKKMLNIKK
jgi:hypothetical protein